MSSTNPLFLLLVSILIINKTSCLLVNHTSIVGVDYTNLILDEALSVNDQNYTNLKEVMFNAADDLYLDIFTGVKVSNVSTSKDLTINNCIMLTNLLTNNYFSPKLVRNTSMISITDSNIQGTISIKGVTMSTLLNGNMINNNQVLITNIYIGNVVVGGSIRLDLKEFTNSILIENVQVNGDLIIENGRIYVGTIIIKNSKINGKLIVENIQVASRINADENVQADDIIICPLPFFRKYKGNSFYGCYTYAGVYNSYTDAFNKCNSLGARMVTIKRKEYLNDLPLFYSSFSPYFYHVS